MIANVVCILKLVNFIDLCVELMKSKFLFQFLQESSKLHTVF